MQYDKINTQKNTNINTDEYRHGEMGSVRQKPIQGTVRTAYLTVLMTVHNFMVDILNTFREETLANNLHFHVFLIQVASAHSVRFLLC